MPTFRRGLGPLAQFLDVSPRTVQRYIARGLPLGCMGTTQQARIVWEPDAVSAWIRRELRPVRAKRVKARRPRAA